MSTLARMQVAVVLSDGVSADECDAFTLVFAQVSGCEVVAVAEAAGHVDGPGGGWTADATFAEVTAPDIVLVPGGLGWARTARDDVLRAWLTAVAPRARWVVASSTGSVVLAAAGLLAHHEAATHWLAAPLLEAYGSPASADRIVEHGRFITCSGQVTAMHMALVVIGREFGAGAVAAARAGVTAARTPAPVGGRRRRSRARRRRHGTGGPIRPTRAARPTNRQLEAPDVIVWEDPTVTRLP